MKKTDKDVSKYSQTEPKKKHSLFRKILLIIAAALGMYVFAALAPALLKDDGIHKYSGVQQKVAKAALGETYDTDILPFFVYFVKAMVEDVYPVCSEKDIKDDDLLTTNCKTFVFHPYSSSSYKVKVVRYTFFGEKTETLYYRGAYLGV
jgi:hypothetical protein